MDIMPDLRLPCRRCEFSYHDAQLGGLSLAVAAHESHLLTPLNLNLSPFEHHFPGIGGTKARGLVNYISRARCRREFKHYR